MHSFYVETEPVSPGGQVWLPAAESAHAARALRLRLGDEVRLLDGQALYRAVLTHVDEGACRARVLETLPSPEAGARITLWQGVPKADKLEWIAQKATELGVWDIWPVEMERSIAGKGTIKKSERLRRIALEAAKQCGRAHVPHIWEACGFGEALARLGTSPGDFDLVVVAWEEAEGPRLSEAVGRAFPRVTVPAGAENAAPGGESYAGGLPPSGGKPGGVPRILLVIGPEGGLGRAECEGLRNLGGIPVTLGRRILRSETAGPCALAVILAALGEM
ncbi:MAG: 16S rRNA (uracil(1498)-N(3))-methyltransferase [Clostridia bacterium]|nr:16S rRNA (uracil(1498)-N(3))-methyltransferase [Clostridia bacterium]